MDIFDKITDTIITTSKEVGQKAKDVSEIAKLQYEIKEKEIALSKRFEEIGRNYYENHKDDENAVEMEEIKDMIVRINELNEQVLELKGARACPKCGAKVTENAVFCSACGAKVNDMFEEE